MAMGGRQAGGLSPTMGGGHVEEGSCCSGAIIKRCWSRIKSAWGVSPVDRSVANVTEKRGVPNAYKGTCLFWPNRDKNRQLGGLVEWNLTIPGKAWGDDVMSGRVPARSAIATLFPEAKASRLHETSKIKAKCKGVARMDRPPVTSQDAKYLNENSAGTTRSTKEILGVGPPESCLRRDRATRGE